MGAFSVTGNMPLVGHQATINVDADGFISGTPDAVQRFYDYAFALEGQWVGYPTGPGGHYGHIVDPFRVWWMLNQVFDDGAVFTGDPPSLPEIPDGAIP